jgi:predicted ATP-dependent serine protease
MDKRIAEAKKLGFDAAIGPKVRSGKKPALLASVLDVREALNSFLEKE